MYQKDTRFSYTNSSFRSWKNLAKQKREPFSVLHPFAFEFFIFYLHFSIFFLFPKFPHIVLIKHLEHPYRGRSIFAVTSFEIIFLFFFSFLSIFFLLLAYHKAYALMLTYYVRTSTMYNVSILKKIMNVKKVGAKEETEEK